MDVKSIVDSVVRIAFKGDKGLLVSFASLCYLGMHSAMEITVF